MISHGFVSGIRIAALNGFGNRLVFCKTGMIGRWSGCLTGDAAPSDGPTNLVQLIEKREQQQIVARLGNRPVKQVILNLVVAPIRRRMRTLHRKLHLRHRLARRVDGRFTRNRRLDREACTHHAEWCKLTAKFGKRVGRSCLTLGRHEGALADVTPQHAFPFKRIQSLAKRRSGHIQSGRKLPFGRNAIPRFIAAVGYVFPQARDCGIILEWFA